MEPVEEARGYVETVEPMEVTREHAGSSRVYGEAVDRLEETVNAQKPDAERNTS